MQGPRGPRDYLERARDPSTSASTLAELATSPYSFVRTAVALHPATTRDTLRMLVPQDANAYADQELVKAIASHPNSDSETLVRVAELVGGKLNGGRGNQVPFGAGVALFCRFDTPLASLTRLLDDPTTSKVFRRVVARQTGREDILDRLANDPSELVRSAVEKSRQGAPPAGGPKAANS